MPLLSVVRERGVIPRSTMSDEENHNFVPEDLTNYKVARAGDLVVNKMKAWQGSLGIAPCDGLVSPAYFVFGVRDIDQRFLNAVLRTKMYVAHLARVSDGVRIGQWDLSLDGFKSIRVPVPPLAEQAAIVRFLDHADRRIRRYIEAKSKLVALLNERHQAIIRRAVTRGLGSTARLRPSGVEWLGDIPAHWDVKRLKWVARLQRGYDLPEERRSAGGVPVISSGGVVGTHTEARARAPGVVLGRYGSTDAVFFVEQDFWPHNTALFVTNFWGNDPKWCFYLLRAISKAAYAGKSAVPGVDRKDLHDIRVPHPSVSEQTGIVLAIEAESADIARASAVVHRELTLATEYRARLTADVVTGRVDVREAARGLPDEKDQSQEPFEVIGEEADDAATPDSSREEDFG